MKLYRPVGFKEMCLILDTENRCFPPRLASQPIFYPVLNVDYATEIAQKWNTTDRSSGYVGYITEFQIDDNYISSAEIHTVGSSIHQEFWIPAESLDEFNKHITKSILITDACYGSDFEGKSTENTLFKEKSYIEQFVCLDQKMSSNPAEYISHILSEWKTITLNYLLWKSLDFFSYGISDSKKHLLIQSIKTILIEYKKWFIK